MKYLTVQDVLWINLQITKSVNRFDYARLEEATFYQYGYGESVSLGPQAARFVKGFTKLKPFDAGNDATGFVASLVFLMVNGSTPALSDSVAADWFRKAQTGDANQQIGLAISADAQHLDHDANIGVREAVSAILETFPGSIASLGGAQNQSEFDADRVVQVAAKF